MSTPRLIRSVKGLLAALLFGVSATSCADLAQTGSGPSYLIMQSVACACGSASLDSDVVVNGTAVIDLGLASIRAEMKNATATATAPTTHNDLTLTRYRVRYRRTDGQNREGIDVPYSFEGASTVTIPVGGSASVVFDLVRQQSKLEPPLRTLIGGGGLIIISTIAEVTFYGRDQAGNDVSVTGSMDVRFGDF